MGTVIIPIYEVKRRSRAGRIEGTARVLRHGRLKSPIDLGGSPADSPARSQLRAQVQGKRRNRRNGNGASRTRTGDLLGAIQALSQLSYSPAGEKSSQPCRQRPRPAPRLDGQRWTYDM